MALFVVWSRGVRSTKYVFRNGKKILGESCREESDLFTICSQNPEITPLFMNKL